MDVSLSREKSVIRLTVDDSNIWSPNHQPGIIDVIADKYDISHRFRAILKSSPPSRSKDKESDTSAEAATVKAKRLPKNDVEIGNGTAEKKPVARFEGPEGANHYAIAASMINYQSLDLGEECRLRKPVYSALFSKLTFGRYLYRC